MDFELMKRKGHPTNATQLSCILIIWKYRTIDFWLHNILKYNIQFEFQAYFYVGY